MTTLRKRTLLRRVVANVQQRRAQVQARTVNRLEVFSFGDAFDDLLGVLTRDLNSAIFIVAVALVGLLIYNLDSHYSASVIGEYCKDHSGLTICRWLNDTATRDKILGAMAFAPNMFIPKKGMYALLVAAIITVVVPEPTLWEYIVQSIALHFFLQSRMASTRILIFGVVVGLYWFGYFIKSPTRVKRTAGWSDVPTFEEQEAAKDPVVQALKRS